MYVCVSVCVCVSFMMALGSLDTLVASSSVSTCVHTHTEQLKADRGRRTRCSSIGICVSLEEEFGILELAQLVEG